MTKQEMDKYTKYILHWCKYIPKAIQWLTDDIARMQNSDTKDFNYDLIDEAEQVLKDSGKPLRDIYHVISELDEKFDEYLSESVRSTHQGINESSISSDGYFYDESLYNIIQDNLVGEFWTRKDEFADDCTDLGIDVDELNDEYAELSRYNPETDETDYVKVWFMMANNTFAIQDIDELDSY